METKKETMLVKYNDLAGNEIILAPSTIRKYLTNNDKVTDQEVGMFLKLCHYQRLNPWLREVYLIKYGSAPAQIITGKEAFTKRANRNPNYLGFSAGLVIVNKETGAIEKTDSAYYYKETHLLIGGWCNVRISQRDDHLVGVMISEYLGRKGDGSVNSMWQNKPATMIRKVAIVQTLREAFPDDLAGMYTEEEQISEFDAINVTPKNEPVMVDLNEIVSMPEDKPTKAEQEKKTTETEPELIEIDNQITQDQKAKIIELRKAKKVTLEDAQTMMIEFYNKIAMDLLTERNANDFIKMLDAIEIEEK